jgi:tripartite-type tricarboxylate transporter receptor subunit TctC
MIERRQAMGQALGAALAGPASAQPAADERASATSSAERQAMAPEIPSFRESSLPQLVVAAHWGLYAPAGTPPAVVQAIGGAYLRAIAEDPVRAEVGMRGHALVDAGAAQHTRILREEFERWGGGMRRAGALPRG